MSAEVGDEAVAGFEDPFEDDRLRFFLEHRDIIRVWAALEREVRDATSRLLFGLQPDLERVAQSLGENVLVSDLGSPRWPRITLYRTSWPTRGEAPIAGPTLSWNRDDVDAAGAAAHGPWVGMCVFQSTVDAALRGRLGRLAAQRWAPVPGLELDKWPDWPMVRFLRADPSWWKDVTGWRARLVGEVQRNWEECAPLIDRAHAEAGAG